MKSFFERNTIKYEEKKLLSQLTTWKIGGPAEFVCYPESKDELQAILQEVKKNGMPFYILGSGSNVLAADQGYRGVIIKLSGDFLKIERNNQLITAGAAVPLPLFAVKMLKFGLGDVTFLAGIPGTLGGAVLMNAGAWGSEIKELVIETEVFDLETMQYRILSNTELCFSYRSSIFRNNKKLIIANVIMELLAVTKDEAEKKMKNYKEQRVSSQPYEYPNAGSVFKNPGKISAGKLIEELGLKGYSIGAAQISEKHANFIVNRGGAKASEVLQLISLIDKKAYETYNIKLEKEIIVLTN